MKRIGISFGLQSPDHYGIHSGYARAIEKLGAAPILFSSAPTESFENYKSGITLADYAKEVISSIDGLILSGGPDVDPVHYRESPTQVLGDIDPVRDRFEIALIKEASTQGKGILAICRGMQILNVANGGSLYQDLVTSGFSDHSDDANEYSISHGITLDEASILGSLWGSQINVNSLHHQAIKTIAPAFRAVAFSHDDIVEAIEGPNCLGVQWHPERMIPDEPMQLAPFKWLLEA